MAGGDSVKFRVRRHLAWLYIVAPHVPARFDSVLFLGLPGILGISPPTKCGPGPPYIGVGGCSRLPQGCSRVLQGV